jgi:cell division protein FtsB
MIEVGEQIVAAERGSMGPKSTESRPPMRARATESLYRVRRRIATGLAVMLAVFLGYHVMVGRNGVNIYEQKRVEDRELHKQIEALQQENDRLKEHVDRLKSDPDAIEHEARERLHYARPGEVIYTLNDSRTADDRPQAAASVNPDGK